MYTDRAFLLFPPFPHLSSFDILSSDFSPNPVLLLASGDPALYQFCGLLAISICGEFSGLLSFRSPLQTSPRFPDFCGRLVSPMHCLFSLQCRTWLWKSDHVCSELQPVLPVGWCKTQLEYLRDISNFAHLELSVSSRCFSVSACNLFALGSQERLFAGIWICGKWGVS